MVELFAQHGHKEVDTALMYASILSLSLSLSLSLCVCVVCVTSELTCWNLLRMIAYLLNPIVHAVVVCAFPCSGTWAATPRRSSAVCLARSSRGYDALMLHAAGARTSSSADSRAVHVVVTLVTIFLCVCFVTHVGLTVVAIGLAAVRVRNIAGCDLDQSESMARGVQQFVLRSCAASACDVTGQLGDG